MAQYHCRLAEKKLQKRSYEQILVYFVLLIDNGTFVVFYPHHLSHVRDLHMKPNNSIEDVADEQHFRWFLGDFPITFSTCTFLAWY